MKLKVLAERILRIFLISAVTGTGMLGYSADKPTVILVDPMRSASDLITALEDRDIKVLLVSSGIAGVIDATVAGDRPHFKYPHKDPKQITGSDLDQFRKSGVTHVIPGVEPSVEFADELAELLGLSINDFGLSAARRNKELMHRVVDAAGLRIPKQKAFARAEAATAWIDDNLNYPVVVKPLDSAGSEDVRKCQSRDQVVQAFADITGKLNKFGSNNQQLLVQEFIGGTEFVLNTVSQEGTMIITDAWEYTKGSANGAAFVYQRARLLAYEDSRVAQLAEYGSQVLQALGVKFGPTHMEIKIDDDGPVLIEVGARLAGSSFHSSTQKARADGLSQLEMIAQVIAGQADAAPYQLKNYAMILFQVSSQAGTVRAAPPIERVTSVMAYGSHKFSGVGDRIHKTIDLFTYPGEVRLYSPSIKQLLTDSNQIESIINAPDFYQLEQETL